MRFIEVNCTCPLTLRPTCLAARPQGCPDRLDSGRCDCPRLPLPRCLLAGGCARQQLGQNCLCDLVEMPFCLQLGCDEQRRGHNCECSRWPGPPCRHVAAVLGLLGVMSQRECQAYLDAWADYLWWKRGKVMRERPLAYRPVVAVTQAARVNVMRVRQRQRKSLWHPLDVTSANPIAAEEIRLRAEVDFLRRLKRDAQVKKEAARGARNH